MIVQPSQAAKKAGSGPPPLASVSVVANSATTPAPVLPNADGTCPAPEAPQCPPVTVDLSLIRDDKGAYRTIASSPDGQVISGVDIPLAALAPPMRPNAVLALGGRNGGGVAYVREFSVFGLGVSVGVAGLSVRQDGLVPMGVVGVRW